jgi:hypothetical protein
MEYELLFDCAPFAMPALVRVVLLALIGVFAVGVEWRATQFQLPRSEARSEIRENSR